MAGDMEGAGKKYFTYRIEEWVGTDSYGTLYRAHDEALDRIAALKVLSAGLSGEQGLVHHFRKNMQQLAQLNHPGIPQVYYFGKQENEYFVALEWRDGGSLSNLIRKDGRMPLPKALSILQQCIDALSVAWKAGIAHGNLKPNNVLVDQNHKVQIADIGLAIEKPRGLENQNVAGATSFMAPELADRHTIDFRTDIYSLGIILYYMLLNNLPSHTSIDEISSVDPSVKLLPAEVRNVLNRMIREDPNQRYGSYEELTSSIHALETTAPSQSSPSAPKVLRRSQKPEYAGDSLFELIAKLYREMSTGVLVVNWNTLQKQFLINRGEIVFFESTQPDENLVSLIKAKQWIGESSLKEKAGNPEALVQLVLQSGNCSLDQLREAYLLWMHEALFQVFRWPIMQGEFYQGEISNESFAAIRLSNVLLEASRSVLSDEWIRKRVSVDSLIKKTSKFEELLASFALNPEESFLSYRLEGEDMKPSTLQLLTGLSEERVLRIVSLLQSIGAIELRPVVVTKAERTFRKPAAPIPRPVAPSSNRKEATQREKIAPAPVPSHAPAPAPPNVPEAMKKVRVEEVLTPVEQRRPPGDPGRIQANIYFQQAQKEYDAGNYGKAAHLCREALQYRNAPEYFHLLGVSYTHHPRFQRDAEEAMHTAISLAPLDADYHASLAAFYSQKQLWLRARTHCLKALEILPEHKLANKTYQKVLENKPGKGNCWCVANESPRK